MKEKLLELLKNTDGYLSGEEIGSTLGVSRAAVWKNINALRKDGFVIEAVTNKGYKLSEEADIISSNFIEKSINTKYLVKKVIFMPTVDSTNEECKRLASEGEKEGTLVVADEQTGGKGRRGRLWKSEKGSGIWMSIILRPEISPWNVSSITLVAGLAVSKAVKEVSGLDAGIKWPNDIYVNGKKLCGILTEMSAQIQQVDFVVVGIGINVNTQYFPSELENIACSLYTEANVKFERNKIIASVWENFEKLYDVFKEKGFEALKKEYEENCINIGKRVRVIAKDGYEAETVGINENGELLVKTDEGEIKTVFSGEVSIRNIQA